MSRYRLAMAAAGLLVVALLSRAVQSDYDVSVITNILYFVMAATGLNIVSGLTGQLSVGNSAFLLIGGYSAGIVSERFDLPTFAGVVVGAVLSGALAYCIGKVSLRLQAFYLGMVTLAVALSLVQLATQLRDWTHGQDGMSGIPPLAGDFTTATKWAMVIMGVGAIAALLLIANLKASHMGRTFEAVRVSPLVANACGIDTEQVRIRAFVVSGAVTGVAGAIFAHWQSFVSPGQYGLDASLLLLLMMTLGGRGSVFGVAIGAALLALLPSVTSGLADTQPLLYGALLIITAAVLPRGVVGLIPRRLRSVTSRRRLARAKAEDWAPPVTGAADRDVLVARGMHKRFAGVAAVDGVDLTIRQGTIHALIGPNGAGKSSTINLITGFESPDEGTITFEDAEIQGMKAHAIANLGIRRTFQTGRSMPELTVLENVMLGGAGRAQVSFATALVGGWRVSRGESVLRNEALGILEWLELGHLAGEYPSALSAGHQRLLEVARVLMGHPQLILLDEPAAGLSALDIDLLAQRLRLLRSAGLTVLLIEHHLDFVLDISDHVTVLDYGQVIEEGSPQVVRSSPAVVAAYLGTDYGVQDPSASTSTSPSTTTTTTQPVSK